MKSLETYTYEKLLFRIYNPLVVYDFGHNYFFATLEIISILRNIQSQAK